MSKILKAAIEENNREIINLYLHNYNKFKSEFEFALDNKDYEFIKYLCNRDGHTNYKKSYIELYHKINNDHFEIKEYVMDRMYKFDTEHQMVNILIEYDSTNDHNVLVKLMEDILTYSNIRSFIYPCNECFEQAINFKSYLALDLLLKYVPDNLIDSIQWDTLNKWNKDDDTKINEIFNKWTKKYVKTDLLTLMNKSKIDIEVFKENDGDKLLETNLDEIINLCIENRDNNLLEYISDNLPENPQFPHKLEGYLSTNIVVSLLKMSMTHFAPIIYLNYCTHSISELIECQLKLQSDRITIKDFSLAVCNNPELSSLNFIKKFENNNSIDWNEILYLFFKSNNNIVDFCKYLIKFINEDKFDKKILVKLIIKNKYPNDDWIEIIRSLKQHKLVLLKLAVDSSEWTKKIYEEF